MELFPAILIGGPPHSGKSVLAYSLTQALRKANVDHYLLRACPDGEGDWANEAEPPTVRLIRYKGQWTQEWVDAVCRDIANRQLPLLVDTGGKIDVWQRAIMSHCTGAILISSDPARLNEWIKTANECGIPVVAALESSLTEPEALWSGGVPLRGRLRGLERGAVAGGPAFDALAQKLKAQFDYTPAELRQIHFRRAPTDNIVELRRLGEKLGRGTRWAPGDIPAFLDELPAGATLAVYDRGPNWLYAALALHAHPGQIYQFDPRLGWVSPPRLQFGAAAPKAPLTAQLTRTESYHLLDITLLRSYLDYTEVNALRFPPVPSDAGLILSGKIPLWLLTSLALLYRDAPWLGVYQPPLGGAVVARSVTSACNIGDVIPLPTKRR